MRPYEGMIAAAGSNPLQSVQRLLQTAAALRTEPPIAKAKIVADLIKQYGVPIQDLADALDGTPTPPGQQRQQAQGPIHDPRVDQILAQQQNEQRQRAMQTQQAVAAQLETFKSTHEFYDDVQQDMAEVIAAGHRRGVAIPLEQAYVRACQLHPEVSKILSTRTPAKAAPNPASTQRSKAAASSVRSTPASGVKTEEPGDLRSAIMAARAAQR